MYSLLTDHFEHASRDAFDGDLAEKQWVIRLRDTESGALCGFSTQMLLTARVDERPVRALFSGDTIVDREHWGTNALAVAWANLALSLIDRYAESEDDLYWFLICKGFRTYRFLPVFFADFYPRHDRPMPDRSRRVLDHLALAKFGEKFDSRAGIVRAQGSGYWLRPGLDGPVPRLGDPHIAYFLARNPNYHLGDELCCLARLERSNCTAAAKRLLTGPNLQKQAAL